MALLRLLRSLLGLIAITLAAGAIGVLGYQQLYWWRHGLWFDLPFSSFWQWARLNPGWLDRVAAQRSREILLQMPLWVCLMVPAIIIGWAAARLGHRRSPQALEQTEGRRERDAA